jgi:hypothetical protein
MLMISGFRRSSIGRSGIRCSGFRHSGIRRSGFRHSGIRHSSIRRGGIRRSGFCRRVVGVLARIAAGGVLRMSGLRAWRHLTRHLAPEGRRVYILQQ